MKEVSQWIDSRIIRINSVSRHFAPWKKRSFRLEPIDGVLYVESETKTSVIIPLSSNKNCLSLQRHHYSLDDTYWLCIRFNDNTIKIDIEIIMKFKELDNFQFWSNLLRKTASTSRKKQQLKYLSYVQSLRDFLKEQSAIQEILKEDDEAITGYYVKDENPLGSTEKPSTETNSSSGFSQDSAEDSQSDNKNDDDVNDDDDGDSYSEFSAVMEEVDSPKQTSLEYSQAESTYVSDVEVGQGATPFSLKLPVPKLRILIMAVGTRGDMQPFTLLGQRLQKDGHRIRLASHACFRDYITSKGLEFYPLAGDPLKLSEFMVKTQGFVLPTSSETMREVPAYHAMVVEMVHSCWEACVRPDPEDPELRPFLVDSIIANPVSYAHIHCAEALGVPLHLMFPQPWVPTKAFPHPLSCLSYQNKWNTENYLSYQVVDRMLWLSFEREFNIFRGDSLGLEPLRVGQGGWNLLNHLQVPFVKMWSPAFVPKPKDWPSHVDVVGSFFELQHNYPEVQHNNTEVQHNYPEIQPNYSDLEDSFISKSTNSSPSKSDKTLLFSSKKSNSPTEDAFDPPAELIRFLKMGNKPIYVGFGSMIVRDLENLVSLFLEAAALVNLRIVFQLGWSNDENNSISQEKFILLAKEAERKAATVRRTERINNPVLGNSLIFPSNHNSKNQKNDENIENVKSVKNSNDSEICSNCKNDDNEVNFSFPIKNVQSQDDLDEGNEGLSSPIIGEKREIESSGWSLDSCSSQIEKNHKNENQEKNENQSSTGLGGWIRGALGFNTNKIKKNEGENLKSGLGFSDYSQDDDFWDENGWRAENAILIGSIPHSWLFQKMAAVVHHGGAGTTAAGLRCGLPTWVCPFFGDQFFWGEMVHRAGLGPSACPVQQLSLQRVADSLEALTSEKVINAAKLLNEKMSQENGVEGAIQAFYKHLPIENMICDVSLFLGEIRLAQVYCTDCGLKMNKQVFDFLHEQSSLHLQGHQSRPCCFKNWTSPRPQNATEGLVQGLGGLAHELVAGVTDALSEPLKGIYLEGIPGAAVGLLHGINSLMINRPLAGGNILISKLREGFEFSLQQAKIQEEFKNNKKEQKNTQFIKPQENKFLQNIEEMNGLNTERKSFSKDYYISLREKNMKIRNLRLQQNQILPAIPLYEEKIILKAEKETKEIILTSTDIEKLENFIPSQPSPNLSEYPEPLLHLTQSGFFTEKREKDLNLLEEPLVKDPSNQAVPTKHEELFLGTELSSSETPVELEEGNSPFLLSPFALPDQSNNSNETPENMEFCNSGNIVMDSPVELMNAELPHFGISELRNSDVGVDDVKEQKENENEIKNDKNEIFREIEPNEPNEDIVEAFHQACQSLKLFRQLGASPNSRVMTTECFTKILHRAVARTQTLGTAIVSVVETGANPMHLEQSSEFRNSDESESDNENIDRKGEKDKIDKNCPNRNVSAEFLQRNAISSLAKELAGGRDYLDFVDFALLLPNCEKKL